MSLTPWVLSVRLKSGGSQFRELSGCQFNSNLLFLMLQVSSGKYPGLVWDDEAKTMFRIPWKHAGKQDFRKDEDAAIFKVSLTFARKQNWLAANIVDF